MRCHPVLPSLLVVAACGGETAPRICVVDELRCNGPYVERCAEDGQVWEFYKECDSDEECQGNRCVSTSCSPDCSQRVCGDDGCDGSCGNCQAPTTCTASGQCELPPLTCGDGTCGADEDCLNCGADCGCAPTHQCNGAGECVCEPRSCVLLGKECGIHDDGCGSDLDCGDCGAGRACNADGQCYQTGANCPADRDCTDLDCGADPVCGESCGTCQYGVCLVGACACTPVTCAQLGKECGSYPDNCGATVDCGICPNPQQCNPDGQCFTPGPNCPADKDCTGLACGPDPVCGENCGACPYGTCVSGACVCTPATCAQLGKECGSWANGCGGQADCGGCTSLQQCNTDGQCYTPGPSCPADKDCTGRECGPDPVCGLSCGACQYGTCVSGTCQCTPVTCGQIGKECGSHPNGCGGTLSCGSCTFGTCVNGICQCTPTTCTQLGVECGDHANGCGGTLSCGSCPGALCISGQCSDCDTGTCCDNGFYRPASYTCDATPTTTQYQCESTACGANAERNRCFKHCTGASSSCTTANLVWTGWEVIDDCTAGEICQASAGNAWCTSCPNGCSNGQCNLCTSSEVQQPGTNLCWSRCPIGQTWSGSACTGTASGTTWSAAVTACAGRGGALPTRQQWVGILSGCSAAVLGGNMGLCNACSNSTTCGGMFGSSLEGATPTFNWTDTAGSQSNFVWTIQLSSSYTVVVEDGDMFNYLSLCVVQR